MTKKYILLPILCLSVCICWAGIPTGYYSSASGKKKAELKAALHSLMQPKTVLSYGSGSGSTWSGFYKTDRKSDNTVIDRYSNETHTFSNTTSAVSGMNIEHSFPKSWWGGTSNNAYKDLFNLMPSESSINSSKSNYAMGVVTNASVDNGCTKVGKGTAGTTTTNLWEPADKWKGDFARGYMYMATCYSNLTWTTTPALQQLEKDDWPTLQEWTYKLLLKWSREDPVDDIEKARNEAVYQIQGNRNPYVDYPNLCEYVWGDSIAYAWNPEGSSQGGDTPTPEPEPEEEGAEVVIDSIAFTTSWDGWTIKDVTLPDGITSVWQQTSNYGAKASAYYNSKNYASESWLMSPEYDLTGYSEAKVTFSHTGKFFPDMSNQVKLIVTDDEGESWYTESINTWMTGSNWTYVLNTTDLSSYVGGKVQFAFCYTSTTSSTPTWEIKYVTLKGVKKATGIPSLLPQEINNDNTTFYDLTGKKTNKTNGIVITDGKIYIR